MSEEDRPDAERWAEALRVMKRQKEAGEWDASRFGDVPERLGPHLIPDGWHTLDEALAVIAAIEGGGWDGQPTNALHWLSAALLNGWIDAHALDGSGRVVRIPSTLWLHLLDGPGGWLNFNITVAWGCLTGAAFEPSYVGLTPVVSPAALRALRADHEPTAQPWASFPSVSAWLRDPASTLFAATMLRRADPWGGAITETRIRRALVRALAAGGYLTARGRALNMADVGAIRRAT